MLMVVNEDTQGKKYYDHEFTTIKKIDGLPTVLRKSKTTEGGQNHQSLLSILAEDVWFNNASKVVDENGEPLVVYHGTDYAGFSVFNTSDVAGRNTGAFFSSEDRASFYTHDDESKLVRFPREFQSWDDVEQYARENRIKFEKDPEYDGWFILSDEFTEEAVTGMLIYSLDPDEAAYFQTLDKVRQFQERVLDKKFDGFATTRRGKVLQNLKRALRYKDKAAIRRYLKEYAKVDGTKKGLQQSMKAMSPLFGLSKDEKKQFLKWITADDRKYLRRADKYFRELTSRFLR